jgi:hypothetical protein
MSHSAKRDEAASAAPQGVQPTQMTAWVGWVAFAGVMMALVGTFHVMQGLVALFKDEYFLVGKSELALQADFTAWGWIHIVGGVVIVAAGFALFAGKLWARVVGVIVALLSAIVNIGFLAAYPIWSVTMVAIDILIIWALTVHGHEMTE